MEGLNQSELTQHWGEREHLSFLSRESVCVSTLPKTFISVKFISPKMIRNIKGLLVPQARYLHTTQIVSFAEKKIVSTAVVTKGPDVIKNDPIGEFNPLEKFKKPEGVTQIVVEEKIDLRPVTGIPEAHVTHRRARIFHPTKNAMQSGTEATKPWVVEFEHQERWENPTMGWTSTGDPLSNVRLWFSSAEDAARFCDKHGWSYFVEEEQPRKPLRKSYADNFAWSKRTRVGSK